jgi:hypothetical protein
MKCVRCLKEIKERNPVYLSYDNKTFQWMKSTRGDNNAYPFGKHCALQAIKENELRKNWKVT